MSIVTALTILGAIVGAMVTGLTLWYLTRQGAYQAAKETIDVLKEQVEVLKEQAAENRVQIEDLVAKVTVLQAENGQLRELVTNAAKVDRLIEMYESYVDNARIERHDIKGLVASNTTSLLLVEEELRKLRKAIESKTNS